MRATILITFLSLACSHAGAGQRGQSEALRSLLEKGVEGEVLVLVFIDASGDVGAVKILKGSSHTEFNEAAERAALAQKWTPGTRDGKPVSVSVKYLYRFRLEPASTAPGPKPIPSKP
jgi:protein TonB